MIRRFFKKPYFLLLNLQRRIRNFFVPTARILLYHRIADTRTDPHLLCVSLENFRNQIKYLKENFEIIPLVKMAQNIRSKKIQNNSIAITFDDGYADNLYSALPILEEFRVPATIFLTSGYINENKPFYWDEDTPREDRGRPMTLDELKRLSSSRLIEIGGHTISHPKLSEIDKNEQFKEIAVGKKTIEEMLNTNLLSFAYPFGGRGRFNQTTVNLVKKAGFHYACSTISERVNKNSDLYSLPRFIVRNWSLPELKQKLKEFI